MVCKGRYVIIKEMARPIALEKSLNTPESKLWRLVNFNPAGFSEYMRSRKPTGPDRFMLWDKQVHEINREDRKKKRIQARNLGKSITCADEVISSVLAYRGVEKGIALIGARGQPTLQFMFDQWLIAPFQRIKFLQFFLVPGDRGVDRKNYEIRLRDGSTIKGRIQGKDGQGFNTVHPNIVSWFDEVQLLDDAAVAELHGMLGPEDRVIASGVPNGVRSSWAYRIDTNPRLGYAGARMTRLDDPRVDEEARQQFIEDYQGEHTSAYRHMVLGEWTGSSLMTFDIDRITADLPFAPDEYPKLPAYYTTHQLREEDYLPAGGATTLESQLVVRPDMPKTASKIYIHADHGITGSPTTIYVSFFDEKEGLRCWRQFMRVLLYNMQTPSQVEIFHYLADTLKRTFKIEPVIGIDTTGQGGQAVYSYLVNMGHQMFWANLAEKVDFGTRPESDDEYHDRMKKDPLGNPERLPVMMQSPLKQVAIPHLKKELYAGQIRLVNQKELWKQIENTTDEAIEKSQDRKYSVDYNGPEGNQPNYDHDLQAFEVLGAMLHADFMAPVYEEVTDMWIEDFESPWGQFDR